MYVGRQKLSLRDGNCTSDFARHLAFPVQLARQLRYSERGQAGARIHKQQGLWGQLKRSLKPIRRRKVDGGPMPPLLQPLNTLLPQTLPSTPPAGSTGIAGAPIDNCSLIPGIVPKLNLPMLNGSQKDDGVDMNGPLSGHPVSGANRGGRDTGSDELTAEVFSAALQQPAPQTEQGGRADTMVDNIAICAPVLELTNSVRPEAPVDTTQTAAMVDSNGASAHATPVSPARSCAESLPPLTNAMLPSSPPASSLPQRSNLDSASDEAGWVDGGPKRMLASMDHALAGQPEEALIEAAAPRAISAILARGGGRTPRGATPSLALPKMQGAETKPAVLHSQESEAGPTLLIKAIDASNEIAMKACSTDAAGNLHQVAHCPRDAAVAQPGAMKALQCCRAPSEKCALLQERIRQHAAAGRPKRKGRMVDVQC